MDGYRVNVVGFTWENFESTYSYSFPTLAATKEFTDRRGRGFRDFQEITDYQLVKSTTSYKGTKKTRTSTHKEEIVKDWTHEDSADKFLASEAF